MVDHINGDTLDNRLSNLRMVTRAENRVNSRMDHDNTLGYKGITQTAEGNYKAMAKGRNIGHFKNPFHAALWRDVQAKKLYGKCAKLNFPNTTHSPGLIEELEYYKRCR